MKYVIKNCDNYTDLDKDWTCRSTIQNRKACYRCQDCTDCVIKRIVELCKNIKSINKTNSYVGEYIEFTQHSPLAEEILELLDIQECE